jgi:hypothetical protein
VNPAKYNLQSILAILNPNLSSANLINGRTLYAGERNARKKEPFAWLN